MMRNKVDQEKSNWGALFSTMSLLLIKQKFELVPSSLEADWEVRNTLLVSFEGCCHSVQNLKLLLKSDVREVCLRFVQFIY